MFFALLIRLINSTFFCLFENLQYVFIFSYWGIITYFVIFHKKSLGTLDWGCYAVSVGGGIVLLVIFWIKISKWADKKIEGHEKTPIGKWNDEMRGK